MAGRKDGHVKQLVFVVMILLFCTEMIVSFALILDQLLLQRAKLGSKSIGKVNSCSGCNNTLGSLIHNAAHTLRLIFSTQFG